MGIDTVDDMRAFAGHSVDSAEIVDTEAPEYREEEPLQVLRSDGSWQSAVLKSFDKASGVYKVGWTNGEENFTKSVPRHSGGTEPAPMTVVVHARALGMRKTYHLKDHNSARGLVVGGTTCMDPNATLRGVGVTSGVDITITDNEINNSA
eukprot:gene39420-15496_t